MPVFAVYLDKGDKEVLNRLRGQYPTCYEHSPNLMLVETNDLAATIKTHAGMASTEAGGSEVTGAVFRLGPGVSGYTSPSLWEWLRERDSMK